MAGKASCTDRPLSAPLASIAPALPGPDRAQPHGGLPSQVTDVASFTAVFRALYAPLVRYADRFTRDAAAAADVVQEVFLKLWADREVLAASHSLRALLYTMVRHRALNAQRHTGHIAGAVSVEVARDAREAVPPGDEALEADDLQRWLHRWIAALPPRRAEAFTLSRYHGLRHSEIAALMGISERSVETHILLALRELRRRLDQLQQEDPTL